MATSSALTLRPVCPKPPISFSPSSAFLSLSPFSLPKRRASSSLMASASNAPKTPAFFNNTFIPGLNSDDFSKSSQKDPDFTPVDVVASSSFLPLRRERKSLQARVGTVRKPGIDPTKFIKTPPPDMASKFLFARVIHVNLPLVPVISELIIAQLLSLQGNDPNEPIYLHIDSTGTANEDGDAVALESDGFAVYDAMMAVPNEVHTFLTGVAAGHACLLLAAGTKGKRYMLPNGRALIKQPHMPAYGEMQTSDLVSRAREALIQRNKFEELLAKHTGNSVEKVHQTMDRAFYMDFHKAKEFGLVDKVYQFGKDKIKRDLPTEEEWKKRRGRRSQK